MELIMDEFLNVDQRLREELKIQSRYAERDRWLFPVAFADPMLTIESYLLSNPTHQALVVA
jgi:hypothetical protein